MYTIEIAENPNTHPEILVEILKRNKNDYVSMYAARNPNTDPEILTEVLRRNNNDSVSRYNLIYLLYFTTLSYLCNCHKA